MYWHNLGNELSLQHQRPWCVQNPVPLCTFMEGRSDTLFGNAVLCHYNYWNSGPRLVYVVIDRHFLCKHRKVQKNAYLFWHEHTVCKFLCHATDVFTCLIVTVFDCNSGRVLIKPYCWEPKNFVYIPVYSFLFLHFQVVNCCLLSHVRCPKRYGLTESV